MKTLLVALFLFLLIGCSSHISSKHYYQLASDFSTSSTSQIRKVDDIVWVKSINIANYLNKQSIIYQTSDVEYITTNHNLWLTSLSDQIEKRVVWDLAILLPKQTITRQPTDHFRHKIELFISAFHGSYSGDGIIQGFWLITNRNGETIRKDFSYTLRLKEDGYPALVKILSQGWQKEEIDLVRNLN